MLLNFRQIEVFHAVMVARSIGGAAELLHVSQPGVSRTLKYIEKKLTISLFERRPAGLIPTPEAEELYKEIAPIYEQVKELKYFIDRLARTENLVLQIGCAPSLSHYVLPKLLARAKKTRPSLKVRVDSMSNEDLAEYIVLRHGDFALSTYDPDHPLVLAERTVRGKILCVVSKDHELANSDVVSLADILSYDVVTYYSDTYIGHILEKRFKKLKLTPKATVQVRLNGDACAMVEHGLGVGFAFDFAMMESFSPNLKTLRIEDELPPIPIFLLRHQGYALSNQVREFIEIVSDGLKAIEGF